MAKRNEQYQASATPTNTCQLGQFVIVGFGLFMTVVADKKNIANR